MIKFNTKGALLLAILLSTGTMAYGAERQEFLSNEENTITNENFSSLQNDTYGGAIKNNGKLTVENSNFTNNTSLSTEKTFTPNDEGWTYDANTQMLTDADGNKYSATITENRITYTDENGNTRYAGSYIYKMGNGGAIYNSEGGYSNIIGTKFEGNQSTVTGGAIANRGGTLTITNGIFNNNTTGIDNTTVYDYPSKGGALYNNGGDLAIENSVFTGNQALGQSNSEWEYDSGSVKYSYESTESCGGAIYSAGANLTITDSKFENNTAGWGGGAIYFEDEDLDDSMSDNENTTIPVLNIKNSQFINNSSKVNEKYVLEYNGQKYEGTRDDDDNFSDGGAVSTLGETITNIEDSYFENNTSELWGGAVSAEDLTVTNSTFKNNITKKTFSEPRIENESVKYNDYVTGDGGAIYAGSYNNDTTIINSSYFEGNEAGNSGGAVYFNASNANISNSTFIQNKAGKAGGAVYILPYDEDASNNIIDTSFMQNTAGNYGGAIYADTNANLNIVANKKDVTFSGNTAEKGGDIYLNNATLNLSANENRLISLDGGIQGQNSKININNFNSDDYPDYNAVGTVIFNNTVTNDTDIDSIMSVNVNAGTLKLGKESYLNNVDLTLEENSTLDLINGSIGDVKLNTLTSNNGNVKLEVDFANQDQIFDFIDTEGSTGTLNITEISALSDFTDGYPNPFVISIHDDLGVYDTLNLVTDQKGVSSVTNDYLYTTIADGTNITISRLTDSNGNAQKIDGLTLAVNGQGTVAGNSITLSDSRTFTANKDIDITGSNIDEGWTGKLGGKSLSVNGNGYTVNGGDNLGILIEEGQTLSFKDTNVTGFKTTDDRKGVLNIKDGGTVNVMASQNDVTIGGVNADNVDNRNAVYLDGTTAKLNLTTENAKSITVNDAVRSSNATNIVSLKGNGKIVFNELTGSVTIVNENEDTVHNNYIDGVTYNLNSGVVKFTNDQYLNGQGNQNSLNFNGGTLDIANNSVGSISLNELNLNANSNIAVDVDLAEKSMDRLTANTYKLNDYNLNVSKMNLLSDATQDTTEIKFADDDLKNNVTTSVSEVAYSPIYKYGVNYDKTSGNFTFSRSAGSGTESNDNNNYQAYNPAVLTTPIASQLGGYMGMLDNYSNSFTHMDMNMLKPLNVRTAELNANKYAVAENSATPSQKTEYSSNDMNSGGVWFKPYMSYDSVRLKHGPKVDNTSYGSFIGGDTGAKSLGNGFYGVLSPYISYQGSHQSFLGNSIYQNGGSLGLTGTLYKGNFFTGLTIGAGASIAEANTMYGHDDFGMFMAGVASKTGYNFEFKDGKYIIQPSVQLSYTMVNSFDYTNNAGVKIESDPLHALQISPNLKFVMNTKSGWQPYLTAGMNWNLIDETKVSANMAALPDMSVKPYVQYGIGIQKTVNDRFTGYLQCVLRNGGRNGIAATGGFRWALGKSPRRQTL